MLPKENRIKKKKDFEIIFKKGASYKNSLFVLRFLKNNLQESRFGFVVSLKVSKKATERNKIRRRLSEIIKEKQDKIKAGNDLVFIVLAGARQKEFLEIKQAVKTALIKTKLINNNV